MNGVDWLSVVRVEKRDEEHETTMVIADNGDAKHPFSRLSRYRVHFETVDDMAMVIIYYDGKLFDLFGIHSFICLRCFDTVGRASGL